MAIRRRIALTAAGAAAAGVCAAALVTSHRAGAPTAFTPGLVVIQPQPTGSASAGGVSPAPPDESEVTWEPGPWGEAVVAGHRLLLPASDVDGPLRDRGDGWSSDYPPTARAAAIAVLRGPWLVFAAPATLRPAVVDTVLTEQAAADPGPVNPQPGWALPPDLLAGFAGQDLATLGAVATLTGEHRATVEVYLRRGDPGGPVLFRTRHHLVWSARSWRIDADYSDATAQQLTPADLPAWFTITVPGDQE